MVAETVERGSAVICLWRSTRAVRQVSGTLLVDSTSRSGLVVAELEYPGAPLPPDPPILILGSRRRRFLATCSSYRVDGLVGSFHTHPAWKPWDPRRSPRFAFGTSVPLGATGGKWEGLARVQDISLHGLRLDVASLPPARSYWVGLSTPHPLELEFRLIWRTDTPERRILMGGEFECLDEARKEALSTLLEQLSPVPDRRGAVSRTARQHHDIHPTLVDFRQPQKRR